MLEIRNASKKLKDQMVLNQVSLTVPKGSTCGIVGNNGAGKTVLFKCILGLYHLDSGEIWIEGKQRGKKDGVYQNAAALIEYPAFLSEYTGLRNLEYLYELNHKRNKAYLEEVMGTVGLDAKSKKKAKNYSVGMKQRLAIAQVLMEEKDFIILDEPMNGLDRHGVQEVRTIIQGLKNAGKTILLASHVAEDIQLLCDVVYTLENGAVISVSEA